MFGMWKEDGEILYVSLLYRLRKRVILSFELNMELCFGIRTSEEVLLQM